MPYLPVNNLELFYEQIGIGEPVVFLHSAYSRGIIAFSCQILDFQQRYTCYFPDFRGHGRTRCESLEWTTPQLAEDILSWMEQMSIEKAHLIGYSLGGNAALYCAVHAPHKVHTLTTIGVSGFADPTGADDYEPEQLIKNGQQSVIDRMIANHIDAHRGNWQELMRQSANDWRLYPQLSVEQLSSIRCPALFIGGEHDTYAGEEQLKRLCELVAGSRYAVILDCSHRPHMLREKPQFVNDLILDFLKEHPLQPEKE